MLTVVRVRELLDYSPETGEFRWRIGRRGIVSGSIAGGEHAKQNGKKYWRISVDNKSYYAHRLAWLITHGRFPTNQIDHIDGNGLNNRLENLRAVSCTENNRNVRKPTNNTSGVSGVHWHKRKQKWMAQIAVNRKKIFLGLFSDKADAAAARKAAEVKYGFHENHGSDRPL